MARTTTDTAEASAPTDTDGNPHEYELKLELAPADADSVAGSPLLGTAVPIARAQRSVYFDTPAGALRRAAMSLRVRHVEARRIQTLKMGDGPVAGLFVRPEWEKDIDSDRPVIDDFRSPLQTLVPSRELARLAPMFEVSVTRRTAVLALPDATIELALDTGVATAGRKTDAVCELELELKGGDPAALFGFARALNAHVPLRLGVLTKFERGARLLDRAADKAVRAQPIPLDDGMTAAAGFAMIAHACLRQFRLNEDIVVRGGGAAALHQARVALRRLRSALSLFKPILLDDRFHHLRAELKWLATALGDARNIDVLLAPLGARRAARPLKLARDAAYGEALAALGSERARLLMLDLVEWIALGAWRAGAALAEPRDAPLVGYAGTVLERFRRRVKKRGRDLAKLDDEARHQLRIEAKKLRYSAEFFEGLFPSPKRRRRHAKFVGALETLQDNLGDLNDLATEAEVLEKLGLAESAAAAALAGDHESRAVLIAKAAAAHGELIDVKRFWD